MRTFESLESREMMTVTVIDAIPGPIGSVPRFIAEVDGVGYYSAQSINDPFNLLAIEDGQPNFYPIESHAQPQFYDNGSFRFGPWGVYAERGMIPVADGYNPEFDGWVTETEVDTGERVVTDVDQPEGEPVIETHTEYCNYERTKCSTLVSVNQIFHFKSEYLSRIEPDSMRLLFAYDHIVGSQPTMIRDGDLTITPEIPPPVGSESRPILVGKTFLFPRDSEGSSGIYSESGDLLLETPPRTVLEQAGPDMAIVHLRDEAGGLDPVFISPEMGAFVPDQFADQALGFRDATATATRRFDVPFTVIELSVPSEARTELYRVDPVTGTATEVDRMPLRFGRPQPDKIWLTRNRIEELELDVGPEPAFIDRVLGDVTFDGVFDSSDLVQLFSAGRYETEIRAFAHEGDFNADGFFDSGDLVAVFAAGTYQA